MTLANPSVGFFKIYNTMLRIKGMNPDDIQILTASLKTLPDSLFKNVQTIYIFPSEESDKKFNSTYENGIVTVNLDTVKSGQDLLKLLCHELFHSLEPEIKNDKHELFGAYQSVENEYMQKKGTLLSQLKTDLSIKKPKPEYWKQIDFSNEFDAYLYNDVTYPVLQFKLGDLFPSPYSVTSLSEYMSVGLEIYLFESRDWLRAKCPALYALISTLIPR